MKLRILFLGDTGVGKTSLIRNLCLYSGSTQASLHDSLKPTKGFAISCLVLPLLVEKKETVEKRTIVELWEWGGRANNKSVFQRALRCIHFDGIVFVYDLTIYATRDSLWKFWAVQVQHSIGDLEGGEERDKRNSFVWRESWSLKRIGGTIVHLFPQLLCVLPLTKRWRERMETYYLYHLSRQFPVAVVGTKSDIWSQRRKLRLNTTNMDGVFYCRMNAQQASQDRSFWNFLSAVLERKSNKINKY